MQIVYTYPDQKYSYWCISSSCCAKITQSYGEKLAHFDNIITY